MTEETVNYLKIDPTKKNRKRPLDKITEVFMVARAYSQTMDEVQDTLLETDLALHSPVDENIKLQVETVEVSAVHKIRKRNYRFGQDHDLPEKSEQLSASQTNIPLTAANPVNELYEQENDDITNQVQRTEKKLVFSALENVENSETYCSKEDITPSSDSIQKQENPEVSYQESGNALSQIEDNVSSVNFSDKSIGFINGARERNVRPTSHDNDSKTSDFRSLCNPYSRQMPEKSVKLDNESEQSLEGPLVASISTLGDSLAEDKSEEKDNMSGISHSSLDPVPIGRPSKKLLILDINGLLADIVSPPPKEYKSDINIARRAIFKRPFYSDFLRFCLERFDVGIWSSRTKKNVERVTDYLLGDMKQNMLFCWDLSHCTVTGLKTLENKHKDLVCKELKKLWEKHDPNLPWERGDYNESNTLLLDDSPYKALLNPAHSAIFPYSYKFQNRSDNSLGSGGDIRLYLEELFAAENVQKYVEHNPFGQSAINESSSSWDFYHRIISSPHLPLVMDPSVESIIEVNQNGGDINEVNQNGGDINEVNQNGGDINEFNQNGGNIKVIKMEEIQTRVIKMQEIEKKE